MAVTYDLELNEVGVGVTSIADIATNSHVLTGLNATSDYQVRVKAVDTTAGVEMPSLWSAWTDFTTLAQLTDVVAALGTISNAQVVHSVSNHISVPEVVVETYDLEVTESGQSPVIITDIGANNHALTGLTLSTDYSVRVRHVKTVNGGAHQSLWSASTAFTTLAALPEVIAQLGALSNSQTIYPASTVAELPDIVAQLSAISNTQAVHSVTTNVVVPDAPVVAALGTLSNTQALHSVDTVVPVIVQLGTLSNAQTIYPVSTGVDAAGESVSATHWIVQLIDLTDMAVMDSQIVFTSSYSAAGLTANVIGDNDYRISIVGVSDLGAVSQELVIDFSTVLPGVSESATFSSSAEQVLDQFYVDADSMYDETLNIVKLFGAVSEAFDTITATFNGAPYTLTVDDLQFTGEELATDPVAAQTQHLEFSYQDDIDGTFTIDVGDSGDTLRID